MTHFTQHTTQMDSVRGELESLELGCHLYPINSIGYGGVHNNLIECLDWIKKPTGVVERLEKYPLQVDQHIELLKKGTEKIYSTLHFTRFTSHITIPVTQHTQQANITSHNKHNAQASP